MSKFGIFVFDSHNVVKVLEHLSILELVIL